MKLSADCISSLTRDEKIELCLLLEEQAKRDREKIWFYDYAAMYPWQRRFNQKTTEFYVCMLMAANQVGKCVSYQTLIDTCDGLKTIGELYECGAEFDVMAWDGVKLVKARASAPFIAYENEPCIRLLLSNGRWIESALQHRVLTSGGYFQVEQLLKYVPCLPQTILVSGQLAHVANDQHSNRTIPDSQDHYLRDSHLCDAQPHGALAGAPNEPPLLVGALLRRFLTFDWGGLANKCKCIRQWFAVHLSNLGETLHRAGQFAECSASSADTCAESMYGYSQNIPRIDFGSVFPPQSCGEEIPCQSFSLIDPHRIGVEIVGYFPIGCHTVYDFSVPFFENYLTAGIINHNSRTGCLLDAVHLTGNYPEDWDGHRFTKPITAWILGYSGEKTRDLLQHKIFGELESQSLSGAYIKQSEIINYKAMPGTVGAVREVRVKHKSGGISVCQFWSYSQGQHALMGDVVDWFHIDEEPKDKNIYPQVLTRTLNGDQGKGGRGIATFTPENGRTELVVQFMDHPGPGDYLQRATWADAPHITDETKIRILASYPVWQRDMRSRGEPLLGAGLIYDMDPEKIKCQPFECPDHWFIIDGMDFGWDHPQAHIQLWWDKDEDIVYLTHAWKKSRTKAYEAWQQVRSWAKGVPTAWPADGLQSEKRTGEEQVQGYREEGWTMLGVHAQWPTGGNSVELGLVELYKAMDDGKFRVFSHLSDFFDEKLNYHRGEDGKIVKVGDDILDAIRYAWMMKRLAVQKHTITTKQPPKVNPIPRASSWS